MVKLVLGTDESTSAKCSPPLPLVGLLIPTTYRQHTGQCKQWLDLAKHQKPSFVFATSVAHTATQFLVEREGRKGEIEGKFIACSRSALPYCMGRQKTLALSTFPCVHMSSSRQLGLCSPSCLLPPTPEMGNPFHHYDLGWQGDVPMLSFFRASYLNATSEVEEPCVILSHLHAVADLQGCDKYVYAWYITALTGSSATVAKHFF